MVLRFPGFASGNAADHLKSEISLCTIIFTFGALFPVERLDNCLSILFLLLLKHFADS